MARCTFCRATLEPGTGKMFVLKDGTILHFCSSKCQRNQLNLSRTGRLTKWTKAYRAEHKESKPVGKESASAESKQSGKESKKPAAGAGQ